jgi:hypothetical protein
MAAGTSRASPPGPVKPPPKQDLRRLDMSTEETCLAKKSGAKLDRRTPLQHLVGNPSAQAACRTLFITVTATCGRCSRCRRWLGVRGVWDLEATVDSA